MRWNLEWGDQVPFLQSIAEDTGFVPPALLNKPEVYEDLEWVLEAFDLLRHSRPVGFSLGPIPLSEIRAHPVFNSLSPDLAEEFILLIQAMDVEFLNVRNERAQREKENVGEHPKTGDRPNLDGRGGKPGPLGSR